MARYVLHVVQPVEAGVPAVVLQLVAHQLSLGWRVDVACPPEGSLPDRLRELGIQPLDWPATRSPGPAVPGEARRLGQLVAAARPDLVHLHSSKAGLVGRLVLRGRRPTVYQPHAWSFLAVTGAMRSASLQWERLAMRWTDAAICVSDDEAATARDHRLRGHIVVCPNGIDLVAFSPAGPEARAAARRDLDISDDATVAVCVGRLCEQKGQDLLLSAWPRVAGDGDVLLLVGDGPDHEALTAAAAGAGTVRFVGQVADARPYYAAADLAVQPSRWEAASMVTREAMASGLGVVTTDVDGARWALGDGCGAVTPIGDVAALAGAIGDRLADPHRRTREGLAARARAESAFALKSALQRVDDLYDSVLPRS